MKRYIVVNGVGSDDIIYNGNDRSAALEEFINPEFISDGEMYEIEIDLNSDVHNLSIGRSLSINGREEMMDRMRIHKNVLDALLEGFDAQTEIPSSKQPPRPKSVLFVQG